MHYKNRWKSYSAIEVNAIKMAKKTKLRIKLKILVISNAIPINKKATIPINVLKSQKTCNSLGDLYISAWKKIEEELE